MRLLYKTLSLILCLGITTSLATSKHALYLSVLEINHKIDEKTTELRLKVFAKDFEDALKNLTQEHIDLEANSLLLLYKQPIEAYFKNALKLTINNKIQELSIENIELINDSASLIFKISCPSKWSKLTIKADYLMELFPTQSNVVSISNAGEKYFFKLTIDQRTKQFEF